VGQSRWGRDVQSFKIFMPRICQAHNVYHQGHTIHHDYHVVAFYVSVATQDY